MLTSATVDCAAGAQTGTLSRDFGSGGVDYQATDPFDFISGTLTLGDIIVTLAQAVFAEKGTAVTPSPFSV
ncbi:MAG: hypothetical protein WAL83_04145 [Arenicellales bacterium]